MGGFNVQEAVLSGTDDAAVLKASWTVSRAAHRYIASLRQPCRGSCFDAWYADVDTAGINTDVPEDAIRAAFKSPLMLDVAALDEHLHAFITTGHVGNTFSVPPVQNVEGGFGVVGSLRFRERTVTRRRQAGRMGVTGPPNKFSRRPVSGSPVTSAAPGRRQMG